jgi:hypothetical protein
MNTNLQNKSNVQKIVLGVMLMLFGLVLIAARWIELGALVMLIPGVVMLVWGCISREAGWIIPGSIVSSIGIGATVLEKTAVSSASETAQGATFLLIFGLGFALITLLTRVFTGTAHFWALIPGGIMAAIGAMLFFGGSEFFLLEFSNLIWAGALVIVGIVILIRALRK